MSRWIELPRLRPHPDNSNVMPDALLDKLKRHVEASGRYPPLIVRPHEGGYQILDGHHRSEVLRRLGHERAWCDVWEVDDDAALLLLATLNRLEGVDDPRRRAALLAKLSDRGGVSRLSAWLPERAERVKKLLALGQGLPTPRPPRPASDTPVPVHFFLVPDHKRRLDAVLRRLGPAREAALMTMVEAFEGGADNADAGGGC